MVVLGIMCINGEIKSINVEYNDCMLFIEGLMFGFNILNLA